MNDFKGIYPPKMVISWDFSLKNWERDPGMRFVPQVLEHIQQNGGFTLPIYGDSMGFNGIQW